MLHGCKSIIRDAKKKNHATIIPRRTVKEKEKMKHGSYKGRLSKNNSLIRKAQTHKEVQQLRHNQRSDKCVFEIEVIIFHIIRPLFSQVLIKKHRKLIAYSNMCCDMGRSRPGRETGSMMWPWRGGHERLQVHVESDLFSEGNVKKGQLE